MIDRRYPHLKRLEDRPVWLSGDEVKVSRQFADAVCKKVDGLRACWNDKVYSVYFYYGSDVENAGWTFRLREEGEAHIPPELMDQVDNVVYALWCGRKTGAEKDAIMESNERIEEQRKAEGLQKTMEQLAPEMEKTMRSRDQERRGVKRLIVGG